MIKGTKKDVINFFTNCLKNDKTLAVTFFSQKMHLRKVKSVSNNLIKFIKLADNSTASLEFKVSEVKSIEFFDDELNIEFTPEFGGTRITYFIIN